MPPAASRHETSPNESPSPFSDRSLPPACRSRCPDPVNSEARATEYRRPCSRSPSARADPFRCRAPATAWKHQPLPRAQPAWSSIYTGCPAMAPRSCRVARRIRHRKRLRPHPWGKERIAAHIFGIGSQALAQHKAPRFRFRSQTRDLRPRCLGIDVVLGHRGNATPIVDPCLQQTREILVAEIRRRLQIHIRAEDDARNRKSAKKIIKRGLGDIRQGSVRLRPEILNDHFLNVAVPRLHFPNGEERINPL